MRVHWFPVAVINMENIRLNWNIDSDSLNYSLHVEK